MTRQQIIEITQQILVNQEKVKVLSTIQNFEDNLNRFQIKTALRMIRIWKRYCQNRASAFDFECSLRNYLLVLKTEVIVPDYTLIQPNSFGLVFNAQDGKIYANYDLPDYLSQKFVQDVFSSYQERKRNSYDDYIKQTNPFVFTLSGFANFQSVEQQLAVMGALKVPDGYTALISMLTGGGKSLITQAVSYQYDNSLTIVIVPTISLMLDQVRNARQIIHSDTEHEIFCYYSGMKETDRNRLFKALNTRKARLLFISPETLFKNPKFKEYIFRINREGYLRNIIVDEAHIIIDWGSSFRVDFQCLDVLRNNLLAENPELRTYLLSATYSKSTVKNLKMFYCQEDRWIEIRLDRLREEPRFAIIKAQSRYDKGEKLKELLCKLPRPMIVYVNTPDDAENLQKKCREMGFVNTELFTGKTNSTDRQRIIEEWTEDKFDMIIATCAFGVGVDKKDVRTVLHLYIPSGANQYYQECGRGGRDRLPCLSVMLYHQDDMQSAFQLTQKVLTVEKLKGRWFSLMEYEKTVRRYNTAIIDTSVKPSYNSVNDEFYLSASNADISWNVYVILLLRRASVITITDVDYNEDKYMFHIRINDSNILANTEETEHLFENIREEEYNKIYNDFKLMKSHISNASRICLSEMFNEIYQLTDEYCAGCNSHKTIQWSSSRRLPLKKPLTKAYTTIVPEILSLLHNTPEMLITHCPTVEHIIVEFIQFGIDVIVIPKQMKVIFPEKLIAEKKNTTVQIMDFEEFRKLVAGKNDYYLSGSILFVFDGNQEDIRQALSMKQTTNLKRIYVAEKDMVVSGRNRNLSEIINGQTKDYAIVESEMKNRNV